MKTANVQKTESLTFENDMKKKIEYTVNLDLNINEFEDVKEFIDELKNANDSVKDFVVNLINRNIQTRAIYKAARYGANEQRGVDFEETPEEITMAWAFGTIIGGRTTDNKKRENLVLANTELTGTIAGLAAAINAGAPVETMQPLINEAQEKIDANNAAIAKLTKAIEQRKAERATKK